MNRYAVACVFGCCALIFSSLIRYNWQPDKRRKNVYNLESDRLWPPNPHEELSTPVLPALQYFKKAAVCSDDHICSVIGRQTLEHAGSAVDAAISTLLCNGLLAIQSMGLGGGLLMNVYKNENRRSYSILSREVSPHFLNLEMYKIFRNSTELQQSSLSIAIPGELMGYAIAHEHFGKLAWSDLMRPTIDICRSGYRLTKHQKDSLYLNKEMIMKDKHLRYMFVDPVTKNFRRLGEYINPPNELCDTYEYLAENGPRSFYNGNLSKKVLLDLSDIDSQIRKSDLSKFQARQVPSVMVPLDEYILHLTPAPGSGEIIGLIMNIIKKFKKNFQHTETLDSLDIHRIVEALKFGFAKRWELDLFSNKQFLGNLTCPKAALNLADMINDNYTSNIPKFYGAPRNLYARVEYGTAHISVLAENGDAVSVTSSINYYFGSGRTGNRTGVLFNNAMSDFSFPHLSNYFGLPYMERINHLQASSSPMSSMAPLIVTGRHDGRVRLVAGAAGGTKIISVLIQLLVRTLWKEQDIKTAIDSPRFHHQLIPMQLEYEYGIKQSDIDDLTAKGHHTNRNRQRVSSICAVERRNDFIYAYADSRKDGGVSGF